ncbi:hypothetical protein ACFSTH_14810 [Paenibacillus yanchengensis]|uniref:Uncharacterized protein n=1 Tax=Paenibacillus yanchengensis TaxID=2035833 RepID=A0ABW4YEU9_9BACL
MNKIKKIVSVLSVAGFLMASASIYAASATAVKPVGGTSTVESVSISGKDRNGTFKTSVTAGTGNGKGILYLFKRLWPDEPLLTHNVYYNGADSKTTTIKLFSNEAYNVTSSGDKTLEVTSSITD